MCKISESVQVKKKKNLWDLSKKEKQHINKNNGSTTWFCVLFLAPQNEWTCRL
jgi:hypothetical protein